MGSQGKQLIAGSCPPAPIATPALTPPTSTPVLGAKSQRQNRLPKPAQHTRTYLSQVAPDPALAAVSQIARLAPKPGLQACRKERQDAWSLGLLSPRRADRRAIDSAPSRNILMGTCSFCKGSCLQSTSTEHLKCHQGAPFPSGLLLLAQKASPKGEIGPGDWIKKI